MYSNTVSLYIIFHLSWSWWACVGGLWCSVTNKFTVSVVQPFSGLPLHEAHCPSSHANVVQKRYPALKTWQSVKRRLCLLFEAINVTEDFKRKTQDWQSKDEWEADRQHVFFPSRGIFCGQAWLLEMKDRLRGCGIVKSLNPFTKAPSYNILLHSISVHLWCALDFPLFSL